MACSPFDQKLLASCSSSGSVKLWSVESHRLLVAFTQSHSSEERGGREGGMREAGRNEGGRDERGREERGREGGESHVGLEREGVVYNYKDCREARESVVYKAILMM